MKTTTVAQGTVVQPMKPKPPPATVHSCCKRLVDINSMIVEQQGEIAKATKQLADANNKLKHIHKEELQVKQQLHQLLAKDITTLTSTPKRKREASTGDTGTKTTPAKKQDVSPQKETPWWIKLHETDKCCSEKKLYPCPICLLEFLGVSFPISTKPSVSYIQSFQKKIEEHTKESILYPFERHLKNGGNLKNITDFLFTQEDIWIQHILEHVSQKNPGVVNKIDFIKCMTMDGNLYCKKPDDGTPFMAFYNLLVGKVDSRVVPLPKHVYDIIWE